MDQLPAQGTMMWQQEPVKNDVATEASCAFGVLLRRSFSGAL